MFRFSLCRAGMRLRLPFVAKISPGFHINAHEPSEEYLIPTKIQAELPPGIALVETTYPHGVMRAFRFSKTPLRVYEGSFTVKMKLRTESAAPLGSKKIGLTIGYQACNQDACLPPTKFQQRQSLKLPKQIRPRAPRTPAFFHRSYREVPIAALERFIDFSIPSRSAMVGTQLAALDSGSRPSRMAPTNSTSWRSKAVMPSSGTLSLRWSVMESRKSVRILFTDVAVETAERPSIVE